MLSLAYTCRLVALILFLPVIVDAQEQAPECSSAFDWARNSKGQSPCVVARYLASQCSATGYTIPPLETPADLYGGPNLHAANTSCVCSTVYYALLTACASCQQGNSPTWTTYTTNCTEGVILGFMQPVPPATDIPQWAYRNLTQDRFNVTAAKIATSESRFCNFPKGLHE
jgi:hypothetical protein